MPTVAWGQAIIGYGINVARAGAAGAAAGAGLGGVFSKVNQPLKRAGQEGAGASQTGKQAGPEFDNDKVPATVSVRKGNPKAAVGADGKLKLKGGTTIAGLSPSPRVARSAQLSTEAREAASSPEATGSYNPGPTPAPAPRPSAAPATNTPELSAAEPASPKPTEKDLAATSGQVGDESPTGSVTAEQAQTTPARNRGVLSPIVGSTDPRGKTALEKKLPAKKKPPSSRSATRSRTSSPAWGNRRWSSRGSAATDTTKNTLSGSPAAANSRSWRYTERSRLS